MKILLALWYAMNALARLAMIGMAMAVLGSGSAHAATGASAGKVQVEVVGKGRPLLMIPGLNSSAEVWRGTCRALKEVQCHLVQLPGFAGAAPADPRPADFLPAMRDQLLAYVHDQKLDHPAVIGHSLGACWACRWRRPSRRRSAHWWWSMHCRSCLRRVTRVPRRTACGQWLPSCARACWPRTQCNGRRS